MSTVQVLWRSEWQLSGDRSKEAAGHQKPKKKASQCVEEILTLIGCRGRGGWGEGVKCKCLCNVRDMAENVTWGLGQEFSLQVWEWLQKISFKVNWARYITYIFSKTTYLYAKMCILMCGDIRGIWECLQVKYIYGGILGSGNWHTLTHVSPQSLAPLSCTSWLPPPAHQGPHRPSQHAGEHLNS